MANRFPPRKVRALRQFLATLPTGDLQSVQVPVAEVRHLIEDCLYAADLEERHGALRAAARALVKALETWDLCSYEECEECAPLRALLEAK